MTGKEFLNAVAGGRSDILRALLDILGGAGSDLRIQVQTDARYPSFIARTERQEVPGYAMRVARLEDVLQGKRWPFGAPARRESKRQKDLADVARIIEGFPDSGVGAARVRARSTGGVRAGGEVEGYYA